MLCEIIILVSCMSRISWLCEIFSYKWGTVHLFC
jgi:hypothetical protein